MIETWYNGVLERQAAFVDWFQAPVTNGTVAVSALLVVWSLELIRKRLIAEAQRKARESLAKHEQ